MKRLRIIGKNIHLSIAEKEWLGVMMRQFACTEQEALEEIIVYKREQAYGYKQKGNYDLERQLLQEIDEWDDAREQEYKQRGTGDKEKKIILL